MKELRNWNGATARGLLAVAALCLLGGEAAAQTQTFAKPGDGGTIEFALQNDSTSGLDATSVNLAIRIVPATLADRFQVNSITIKEDANAAPPITIAIGQTRTFVVNYTITQAAQDGDSFQVFMDAALPDQMVLPDPSSWGTVTNFPIGRPQFLVGAKLRDVWQGEAFDGLKFRRERRAYRQALRAGFLPDVRVAPGGFVSYSGVGQGDEPIACGCSGAIGCGGWIYTSENPGPATYIREAREAPTSKASQALVMVRAEARGITRASSPNGTRFFRPGTRSAGPGAQPRLSGQKHRFYRLAAGSQVMSLATSRSLEVAGGWVRKVKSLATIGQGSIQRLAKPSAYRPQGGKPTVCSPLRTRNCRLPVYIECPSRIQTWASRFSGGVPEGTRTADLLIHIAYSPSSTRGPARGRFAGSSGRSTNAVRRLKKVPAVGELTLAVRRGFLFVGTAGKAGKKVRGAMKGKLATSDELARSVSIFGAAFSLLGGHFASKRLAKCTPRSA